MNCRSKLLKLLLQLLQQLLLLLQRTTSSKVRETTAAINVSAEGRYVVVVRLSVCLSVCLSAELLKNLNGF